MASVVVSDLHKKFGETHILKGVSIEVPNGSFAVLVGPSGCGKSTLLRLLAGLEEATSGAIRFDERDVTQLAPRDRDIAMVFQSYALYPHLSVRENLAFGLKLRKTDQAEIEKRVKHASAMLGLDNLLDRLPKALSGGQRQRVAMGRAIVRRPSLFLFDEPLSNLDAALRAAGARGHPEAARRARRDERVRHARPGRGDDARGRDLHPQQGVVEQAGHPLEVYARPATRFVASFLGSPAMNFVDVELAKEGGGWFAVGKDELRVALDPKGFEKSLAPGKKVTLGVRPHEIELHSGTTTYRTTNEKGAPLIVTIVEALGTESFAHGKLGGVPFVARLDATAQLKKGETVELSFKSVHLFDPESGRSLREEP